MKNSIYILILSILPFMFSGCEVIGDIFKAGVWVGAIIVFAIIAVIIFIIKLFTK